PPPPPARAPTTARLAGPEGSLEMPVAAPAADSSVEMPAPAPEAGRDFSGTNLQEAGVDEPDVVKTDGRTLYTLTDGVLHAVDVTGDAPRVLGALGLEHVGAQSLLLFEGRLLVLGTSWAAQEPRPLPVEPQGTPEGPVAGDAATSMPAPAGPPRTYLLEIDVGDPAAMEVVGRVNADGTLVTARRTGSGLRLVLANAADPAAAKPPARTAHADLDAARRENRRALASTGPADWLPRIAVRRRSDGATVRRVMTGCRGVARPATFSGLGMVNVVTVALDRGLTVTDSDAVLTDAQTVYASPTSLYVATPRWVDPAADTGTAAPPRGSTEIHRFDITQAATTTRAGHGRVRGYTLNQFSLSEHEGHLRVATTEEPAWWGAPEDGESSESIVTVLAPREGRLVQTGLVDGLGRTERIYSVRFMGDRGYVVTFRQTDPLYSLDLSDPTAPRVTGELKINGYSSYLHPIDDDTLIGIGQDATPEGRILGTQVSLFDVSDPGDPTRLAQQTLGTGYSEAEDDHLAVLYWKPTGLLAIPLESYGGRDGRQAPFTGAIGLTVTRTAGVADLGRITHPDDVQIRRAVVAGDALYTVSAAGVRRSSLTDLADRGFAAFG
ncbi:MAG: beta-propeller domain-containing protein, partial [Miltoncostaeaceae bacterium]